MENGSAICIIPARYASSRLPGKPLVSINNKPMIVHVCDRAAQAKSISRVIVATDDERIVSAVTAHGYEARLTSPTHQSGTDRIAEVAATLDCDVVVNVQGDEPLIDPSVIDAAVEPLWQDAQLQMSTIREPIASFADVLNPNVVKVVTDENGLALYFSRAPIPYPRAAFGTGEALTAAACEEIVKAQPEILQQYYKHTGLYVYRRHFLLEFAKLTPTALEKQESLEQLRALQHGFRIKVVTVTHRSVGVDTPQDLEQVRSLVHR